MANARPDVSQCVSSPVSGRSTRSGERLRGHLHCTPRERLFTSTPTRPLSARRLTRVHHSTQAATGMGS